MDFLNDLMRGSLSDKLPYIVVLGLIGFLALRMFSGGAAAGELMSPKEANDKAMSGEVVLVDVRTPQEWQQTGLPASGYAITMHQAGPEFMKQLDAALGGDRSKPLAIICRTGNRTSKLVGPLEQAGYTHVINVAEGMVGGRYGPGWIKTGLPLRKYAPGAAAPDLPAKQK
ncbi:MAG: rhodanese-like domain-containing protein [Hyphomicrobiaceae bacterium]|nr:rhodanese-like domain-containing protein [Hyphomicrobiaceae bacterium]MCC0011388.1 rhodanese-like domain-containing protein [Hyphomicrobiaceae bacterium]